MLKGVQRGAIMLVKCLEHKSYEEQPKEQEFFSLEEAQETSLSTKEVVARWGSDTSLK